MSDKEKDIEKKTAEPAPGPEHEKSDAKPVSPAADAAKPTGGPEGPDPQLAKLQAQVDDLTKQLQAAVNEKYRAFADADNMKKRIRQEAETADKYRIQSFALEILPALDNMERALAGKDDKDPFIKGIRMVYDQIHSALTKEGLSEIECLDKPFDPNYHHAIMTEKVEGVKPNMVVEVLQKGYMLKDRLLRAALVKVSE